ncbi:bifunctional demethylmenaquinone methyltransferase/2-methoxy-6-polyprenyl-1,4-benzoquinol methylase UbiE [Geitlerinema sp. PCC 9228]|jgi:demethylmenaquinone methyltransferase/2-methoxy-6-polyprenyl-1,4-benzoquinol methylase|uniref:bifunctional demethylmenaquinone methyltransferase/2-methoxy-6-polyprenyl-1,4-benzoquinol methylase UbiE n=1 Tax=Geitlerinema sp. PCC 9228 TaxID=111611 RepID=UPI0008F9CF59|nr:bifunctional demethylmenaquinone methyltransferase/2-methoxy-6-polyprenyl-1,4-benzoquinol methylase UbiE [Geitlerinema sp. PCC 9228]
MSVKPLFDRIAPVYDRLNDWFSFGQHRIWKMMAVKWSQAGVGDTCLDLCCGSGDLTRSLAWQVGETGQVYGVDFSWELLQVARKKSLGYPNISWIEADVLHLPFADCFCDAVTMGYGLRNVADISGSLQEIHRVLKPNATAAILDFHRPDSGYMRQFQKLYLQTIVVPIATQMGLGEEYAYLAPSIERFPNGKEQINIALQVGFANAVHYPIANGIMGVLVVTKR